MNTGCTCFPVCFSAQQASERAVRTAGARTRADEVYGFRHLHQLIWADVRAVREAEIQQRKLALQVVVAERLAVLINQLPGAADGRLAHGLGRGACQKLCVRCVSAALRRRSAAERRAPWTRFCFSWLYSAMMPPPVSATSAKLVHETGCETRGARETARWQSGRRVQTHPADDAPWRGRLLRGGPRTPVRGPSRRKRLRGASAQPRVRAVATQACTQSHRLSHPGARRVANRRRLERLRLRKAAQRGATSAQHRIPAGDEPQPDAQRGDQPRLSKLPSARGACRSAARERPWTGRGVVFRAHKRARAGTARTRARASRAAARGCSYRGVTAA